MRRPQQLNPNDRMAGNVGEACTVTLAAGEGLDSQPIIAQINCGYSATEEAIDGTLTIANDEEVLLQLPITASGAAPIIFDPPIFGFDGQDLVITLSAVNGAIGYINVTRGG